VLSAWYSWVRNWTGR